MGQIILNRMKIGILGCFQNGKSTLINCLLGSKFAQTGGDGVSITSANTVYSYSAQNALLSINGKRSNISLEDAIRGNVRNAHEICIGSNAPILKLTTFVDTPGFNANARDTQIVLSSLCNLDVAIVLINNKGLSDFEINILKELQLRNIPYYVVMNCLMQQAESTWHPDSEFNKKMLKTIIARLDNNNLTPMFIFGKKVTAINAIWYWYATTRFQLDSADKQKALMNYIHPYQMEYPQTDYLNSSNVPVLIDFFMSSLNTLPIRIYNSLYENTNNGIERIITGIENYSSKTKQLYKRYSMS